MIKGKGIFIWQIASCEGGSPTKIAAKASAAGFSHVLLKIGNGASVYQPNESMLNSTILALRSFGIEAWGWHYVYGDNPTGEANIAISQVQKYGLDGYVIDAEGEYETQAKTNQAKAFMNALRASLPTLPIALCSYRYPSLHPGLPWAAFLEKCDLNMPQVYWEQSHNPGNQLTRSVSEFSNPSLVRYMRHVHPVGAAYDTVGWKPTPAEITEFFQTAKNLGLSAASAYSWDASTRPANVGMFDAISAFPWPVASPGPAPEPTPPPAPLPDRTLGFFTFLLKDEDDLQPLFRIIEYHNRTGLWPAVPNE